MNETTIESPKGDMVHETLVDESIAQMKRLQEQMADDRKEILTMQAETRAILDDVMAMLKAA